MLKQIKTLGLDFTARRVKIRQLSMAAILLTLAATSGRVYAEDVLSGPDVVIIASEDKIVYEFRQNGELRMVRIVPKFGRPYYLVPRDNTKNFGNLERADMLLPQWVIAEF